jgi:hypothetical protein
VDRECSLASDSTFLIKRKVLRERSADNSCRTGKPGR